MGSKSGPFATRLMFPKAPNCSADTFCNPACKGGQGTLYLGVAQPCLLYSSPPHHSCPEGAGV